MTARGTLRGTAPGVVTRHRVTARHRQCRCGAALPAGARRPVVLVDGCAVEWSCGPACGARALDGWRAIYAAHRCAAPVTPGTRETSSGAPYAAPESDTR